MRKPIDPSHPLYHPVLNADPDELETHFAKRGDAVKAGQHTRWVNQPADPGGRGKFSRLDLFIKGSRAEKDRLSAYWSKKDSAKAKSDADAKKDADDRAQKILDARKAIQSQGGT